MQSTRSKPKTIDEYISRSPREVRETLEELRRVIKETAPEAEETISYAIPAFKLNGKTLVYFAAFKKHIGFYPTSSPMEAFKKELAPFKHAKGSIQFPLENPIPYDLVKKIVKFRVKENESKKK
jgi:uncharacterized protein YdhG (YjbR/CyaY superfamily)